jgi:hypothetical protein
MGQAARGRLLRRVKKWNSLKAMLALCFSFFRIRSTIRCTLVMESGLTGNVWTLRELLAS